MIGQPHHHPVVLRALDGAAERAAPQQRLRRQHEGRGADVVVDLEPRAAQLRTEVTTDDGQGALDLDLDGTSPHHGTALRAAAVAECALSAVDGP